MGRFIGLTKNKGSGLAIEDPDFANSGLVLTSNGTGFVLAGGASLDRSVLPDFVNANQSISSQLVATGAFGDSVYTFSWRNGVQYGLALTSSGSLTGAASNLDEVSTLEILITDSTYDVVYEADITINVSITNSYPAITTSPTALASLAPGINTFTFAGSNSPTEWTIVNLGTLPVGTTINNGGVMTIANSTVGTFTYQFTLGVRNASLPAGVFSTTSFNKPFEFQEPIGQAQYQGVYGENGGQCSYTWVAPSGVSTVDVMAIGAGGGGRYNWADCGGHGGGMVWANNIPVVPGQSYCIQVGRGGCWSGNTGGCSCWPGMNACGGCCGCYGGCFSFGDVNASAGSCCGGYGMIAYDNTGGGGGGGPGYCSAAPASSQTANYCGCGGGGGSATSHHSSTFGSGGGGGTGSCGMCCYRSGACGACGNPGYSHQTGSGGQGGSGGSCGNPGEPWSNWRGNGYNCGGSYGGGGGGGGTQHGGGWGGPGVVRIIWGSNRCWPCCDTHNL